VRRTRTLLVVWALLIVVAVEIVVTYTRVPPTELYHFSGHGLVDGGLSRAVTFANWPAALIALAILALVFDRSSFRRRAVAVLAAVLCVAVVWPGVVSQANLDAKPANAIAAAGVALALALSVSTVALRPDRIRGDRIRIVAAAMLLFAALPWIAADLGFFLNGVPLLGRIFLTGQRPHRIAGLPPFLPAVHHGHHHGMDGVLLVLAALLLSRLLGAVRAGGLHAALGFYLALMIAYGTGNILNDGWNEQFVKRGWSNTQLPNVEVPHVTYAWLTIVLVSLGLWLVFFRPRALAGSGAAAATGRRREDGRRLR
jgi:hypothetical protein